MSAELWHCTAPIAPLMASARADAEQVSQMLFGEQALVLAQEGAWWRIRLAHDGYEGFVPRDTLAPLPEDAPPCSHVVGVPQALRFPAPDIKAAPASPLYMGSPLRVVEQQGDFLRLAAGGWLHARHVLAIDAPRADAASWAEKLLHAPYLWGGRSWAGIDCSGLVQLALRMAGKEKVPRDSGDQARQVGAALPLAWLHEPARLKRGDLVFWRGHVAMLLDEARIIHANAHHMRVAIEPLAEALARIAADGSEPVALRRP